MFKFNLSQPERAGLAHRRSVQPACPWAAAELGSIYRVYFFQQMLLVQAILRTYFKDPISFTICIRPIDTSYVNFAISFDWFIVTSNPRLQSVLNQAERQRCV